MCSLWDEFVVQARLDGPDLRSTVDILSRIPYGRPKQLSALGVIRDWRGTCSTKHLLLADLVGERWPSTEVQLWHRVYTVTAELAATTWGDQVAAVVPEDGLVDVHTYATAVLSAEPVVLDVTFPADWDGSSSMAVASGPGDDVAAGDDPLSDKQRLVARYCDPTRREAFITALTSHLGQVGA